MYILTMTRSAGNERAAPCYVFRDYGAWSPDRTRPVQLPPTLYNLWVVLTDHPNEVVSYLTLTRAYWPTAEVADPDTTGVHIGRLKKLLAQVGWPADTLKVVWGRGVMFRPPRA